MAFSVIVIVIVIVIVAGSMPMAAGVSAGRYARAGGSTRGFGYSVHGKLQRVTIA
jgi:hypothetical protein